MRSREYFFRDDIDTYKKNPKFKLLCNFCIKQENLADKFGDIEIKSYIRRIKIEEL